MPARKTQVRAKNKTDAIVSKPENYVPLSGPRNVLTVDGDKDPNRVYRWINDVDTRIARAIQAGYRHEMTKDFSVGEDRAGTATNVGAPISKPVGSGVVAYLMSVDKDLYNEVQKNKQDSITHREETMVKGVGKAEGHYGNMDSK